MRFRRSLKTALRARLGLNSTITARALYVWEPFDADHVHLLAGSPTSGPGRRTLVSTAMPALSACVSAASPWARRRRMRWTWRLQEACMHSISRLRRRVAANVDRRLTAVASRRFCFSPELRQQCISDWARDGGSRTTLLYTLRYSQIHNPVSIFIDRGILRHLVTGRALVPMQVLSFWTDVRLAGYSPQFAYLHQTCSFLLTLLFLYLILIRVFQDDIPAAVFVGVLWVLLPSTSVVVQFLSTRHYLEGMLFSALALCLLQRGVRPASVDAGRNAMARPTQSSFRPSISSDAGGAAIADWFYPPPPSSVSTRSTVTGCWAPRSAMTCRS